jgi:hypothetical protein
MKNQKRTNFVLISLILGIPILVISLGEIADRADRVKDLHLKKGQHVTIVDSFYGNCKGDVDTTEVDSNGVRHYGSWITCDSQPTLSFPIDYSLYVQKGYIVR